ncbi:MAG: type I glyceraldehyde-3-phosphate dehydrogenase [Nanoarchaeota archaeon]
MKVAINGFGRIGRQFFLAAMQQKIKWDFIINNPSDLDSIVYLLKHDSVYSPPKENITHDRKHLIFGGKKIKVISEQDPEKLPWKKESVDIVIECTGKFTHGEDAIKHITAGAKKVLISAPGKNCEATIIIGVNDSLLKNQKIVSAGSCTTNCVAPLVKVLDDAFQIQEVLFITTHAYTSSQHLVDAYEKKDVVRGRAAGVNIIPTTSGAATSAIEAIPSLKGKLDGYALRVPVVDGSIASLFAKVKKKVTKEQINSVFKNKASRQLKNIIQYSNEKLVSTDIIGNTHSCIYDSNMTYIVGDLISIAAWYDNEMGYAYRLADVAKLMLKNK